MDEKSPRTCSVLGLPLQALSRAETLALWEDLLGRNTATHVVTVNPEMMVATQRDIRFRTILLNSVLLADGIGIVWASRVLHFFKVTSVVVPERLPGVEMLEDLCGVAAKTRRSVFLLGGGEGIAKKAAEELRRRVPELSISVYEKPHCATLEENRDIQDAILQAAPAVLFVAYGAPLQEKWIALNKDRFPSLRVAIGVGGALDLLSGTKKRAPGWVQHLGLEWLWRFVREPARFPRILRAVVVFPVLVLFSCYAHKRYD